MIILGYRRYLSVFACAWLLAAASLSAYASWLQPLTGDLARLGGYSENEFGWNGSHPRFEPPLASPAALGRRYEIVVVGDSFSLPVEVTAASPVDFRNHWTDFLAARTGMSIGSFNRDRVSVDSYLSSAGFLRDPPKLFVAEYAERTLHTLLFVPEGSCETPGPPNPVVLRIDPHPPRPVDHFRDVAPSIDSKRIDAAIDHVRKAAARWLLRRDGTPVSLHPLSRRGLLSSADDRNLLAYQDDFAKARASDAYLDSLACYFQALQRRVEANGVTRFVLMVPPDRTTAYGEYLPDVRLPNLTERLSHAKGLSLLRLDEIMRSAVHDSVMDVYDPADTHWASAGMALAADALIRFVSAPDAAISNR